MNNSSDNSIDSKEHTINGITYSSNASRQKDTESKKDFQKRIRRNKSQNKYQKKKIKGLYIGLSKIKDIDIILYLEKIPDETGESISSYVKRLIREDKNKYDNFDN